MKFAHKLFEIARKFSYNPNPKAVNKYFDKILKEVTKQAERGHFKHKFVFKTNLVEIKEPLAQRLYEEGFEVETRHFPSMGDLDIIVQWDKKEPKEPNHRYLP